MSFITEVKDKIFSVHETNFEDLALEIFRYQAAQNPVYKEYLSLLHIEPDAVKKVAQIPFLPIELFKSHKIMTGNAEPEVVFESSGTTGMIPSRHYVSDAGLYKESLNRGFRHFFGAPEEYTFLALLPSYLERQTSSLTFMMQTLMDISGRPENGFYLYDHESLDKALQEAKANGKKVFFIGVSFALLDFSEAYRPDLSGIIVMDTGGMKGRRKEMIREEVHGILKEEFNTDTIMSEYGMTELLSQAYSRNNGIYETPPWMRLLIRDVNDPFAWVEDGKSGGLNVIDLANVNSCSFIATQDLGRKTQDGFTEILGRFDYADMRGCSLMYE